MKLQANLLFTKAPILFNNIEWLSISIEDNAIYVLEQGNENAYKISIDDILALSIYDFQKGGGNNE